jgi:hypothetical protein
MAGSQRLPVAGKPLTASLNVFVELMGVEPTTSRVRF